MCRRNRLVSSCIAIGFALAAFAAVPEDPSETVADPTTLRPVHSGRGKEAVAALEDAVAAFIREDAREVQAAFEKVRALTRLPAEDEDPAYPRAVRRVGSAFGLSIEKAIASSEGDLENTLSDFYWVQRVCLRCHVVSRQLGIPVEVEAADAPPPTEP